MIEFSCRATITRVTPKWFAANELRSNSSIDFKRRHLSCTDLQNPVHDFARIRSVSFTRSVQTVSRHSHQHAEALLEATLRSAPPPRDTCLMNLHPPNNNNSGLRGCGIQHTRHTSYYRLSLAFLFIYVIVM